MKQILASVLLMTMAGCASALPVDVSSPAADCSPSGWDRAKLDALKGAKFEIADEATRQTFAKAIVACLASPDPALRDGIAYEALTHMLRGKQLSVETTRALKADLLARLAGPEGDGFARSFAALALSEVARTDRIEAWMSEDELIALLVDAQHWFINISDYRGFDPRDGWRHAVAHGSDLLMQLALNPRIDAEGLRLIVSAVGVQVAPKGHAYVFGESDRLARPVLVAAARGGLSEAQWSEWLKAIATPPESIDLFGSAEGLAWRHDADAFLRTLYVNARLGSDPADDVILPAVEAALKAMP